jgi:hypothetical protein
VTALWIGIGLATVLAGMAVAELLRRRRWRAHIEADEPGLIPAFDKRLPTGTATYSSEESKLRSRLRRLVGR